jgi:murein DD-endopeptidase MepM/ murein hydrolase activator NlpD
MHWCIDWAMPIGTPVLAARSGIVLQCQSKHWANYTSPVKGFSKANFVVLLHEDYEESLYSHLAAHSVTVRTNQRVQMGDIIGLSGQTGYATYPHLHFGVFDVHNKNVPPKWDLLPEIKKRYLRTR